MTTKKYVLLGTQHKSIDKKGKRVKHEKGDVVDLTPAQAEAFKGKFKSVDVVRAEAKVLELQAGELDKKEPGNKEPGNKEPGNKEPDNKEPGNKEPGSENKA